MPKSPITPVDAEIEEELAKRERNKRESEANQSADSDVEGGKTSDAERQPS